MDTNPRAPGRQELPSSPASAVPPSADPPVPGASRGESDIAPSRFARLSSVFAGSEGPYAAMRWVIYLVVAYVLYWLINGIVQSLHPFAIGRLRWMMVIEGLRLLAVILPAFLMVRIERQPFGAFGLPARHAFRRNFWVGALWGIASLSLFLLALSAAGAFTFGTLALQGPRILKFAVFYAVFFLITGLFEEFLLRGYSQWVLTRALNFWPAAMFLSFSFGAMHSFNPGESKIGLAAAALIGLFFCLTLRRTGDLWWAVGFHMAWDWGESYLYSVPDSGGMAPGHLLNSSFHGPTWLTGGSVGPEGSLLVFAVIAALWVVFQRMYPEVKYGRATASSLT